MKTTLVQIIRILAALALGVPAISVQAQGARSGGGGGSPAPAFGGGRGGARGGGIPNATPEQNEAVVAIQAKLAPLSEAVAAARAELATSTFAEPRNNTNITAAAEKVRSTELALANARAEEFGKLQLGPQMLSAEQIPAFVAMMSRGGTVLVNLRGGGGAVLEVQAGGIRGGPAPVPVQARGQ